MSPTYTCLLLGLLLQADQKPNPEAPPPAPPQATVPVPAGSWARLRAKISERLHRDRERLREVLERTFVTDLALDYQDRENRAYLDRKLDEVVKLDPDVGIILIDYLDPKGGGGLRNRAENAVRALERLDLTAFEPRLRALLASGSPSGKLRALYLLAVARVPDLAPVLRDYLVQTPEAQIHRVLEAVGRYGDPSLTESLLPFLSRPSAEQRLAALRALARLGARDALEPATKAAAELAGEEPAVVLLGLLRAVAPKLDATTMPAFLGAAAQILARSADLGQDHLVATVQLLAAMPVELLAPHFDLIQPRLDELIAHRYPQVQFEAAKLLDQLGDKSGIRRVLDRLSDFVKRNKKVPYAYYQRARAYEAFDRLTDALRDVQQAIKLSAAPDPALHLFAASLEVKRGNPSQVLRQLKAAEATTEDLRAFRRGHPEIEDLLGKNRDLQRLFEGI